MVRFFSVLFSLLTVSSVSLAGEVGSFELNANKLIVKVGVAGTGTWVCAAEDSFKEVPVLGRGQTEREAQILAMNECGRVNNGNQFFCEVTGCEMDRVNTDNLSVIFDVTRDSANISIGYRGKVKHACYSSGWDSAYVAKAATKTEALALAKTICAYDEGTRRHSQPSGFFCEADESECESISGGSGAEINIDEDGASGVIDIFGDIFTGIMMNE